MGLPRFFARWFASRWDCICVPLRKSLNAQNLHDLPECAIPKLLI
jgi:hypothetical protein